MAMTTPALLARTLATLLVAACAKPATPAVAEEKPTAAPTYEPSAIETGTQRSSFVADRPLAIAALSWSAEADRVARAQALLKKEDYAAAATLLQGATSPAAALVHARSLRGLGRLDEAAESLESAASTEILAELVALERGLLAAARGNDGAAATGLLPLLSANRSVTAAALTPLIISLATADPEKFLRHFDALEAALPDEMSARSVLLGTKIDVLTRLERLDEAKAVAVQRYLEEPVALETPAQPPAGTLLTTQQLLARAEVLLAAHRNERVIEAMSAIPAAELSAQEQCRLRFGLGLAHRKLHHYSGAEGQLTQVVERCADDLARRAMYILAKVISIKSGLRAIDMIERFAERFAGHTMVDDVLFWAGDLYQRRGRYEKAASYYQRIEALATRGDHCADARWRLAWMAYRTDDLDGATQRLERTFLDDGCAPATFDRSRAYYWLGRIASMRGRADETRELYAKAIELTPLGFYGQLALKRLLEIDPSSRAAWHDKLRAPAGDALPALCPGWLATNGGFARAVDLLTIGLREEAAEELLAIAQPEQKIVAKSHAVNQGIEPKQADKRAAPCIEGCTESCGAADPGLLIALLLDRAGAHRESHWRLRTEFAELLERLPSRENIGLFKAAYPLAYRDELRAAEEEHGLPPMFLQALSREESAFDAQVVSWAGAYGLTQLLLRTGQRAGALLDPPVTVTRAEELLEPGLNARLGGAFMATLMNRYGHNPALSLVAYNASEKFASTLWKRHRTHGFDHFAEEITIRETRGYVKRVLRTFGIYRWLYTDVPPELPIALELPQRS